MALPIAEYFVFWRSFVGTGQCCLCPSDKEGCPKRQERPIDSRMNSSSHFLSPFPHVMSVQQPPSSRAAHKSIKCPLEEFAGISIRWSRPSEPRPRIGLGSPPRSRKRQRRLFSWGSTEESRLTLFLISLKSESRGSSQITITADWRRRCALFPVHFLCDVTSFLTLTQGNV